eukprot:TRINITY_DN34074_c0_g1_i1.p1 TRINITY_DN34074_c0_g1~~TRINITY_DN34074_c0_g1_i1.p1  ORF type:complete len:286 (+),score=10.53 TRINITY_DN34074_c0_g1_i1:76-933(+)
MAYVLAFLSLLFSAVLKPVSPYRINRRRDSAIAEALRSAQVHTALETKHAIHSGETSWPEESYGERPQFPYTFLSISALESKEYVNATHRSKSEGLANSQSLGKLRVENELSTVHSNDHNTSFKATSTETLMSDEHLSAQNGTRSKSRTDGQSGDLLVDHRWSDELGKSPETPSSTPLEVDLHLRATQTSESSVMLTTSQYATSVESIGGLSVDSRRGAGFSTTAGTDELTLSELFFYIFDVICLGVLLCICGCSCCCIFGRAPPRDPVARLTVCQQQPISISDM